MKLHLNPWSWGLLFGRLSTDEATVNIALVGPIEVSWAERPGLTEEVEAGPRWWFWSPSRVFSFELGRAKGAADAYGLNVAFDPFDPMDRAIRVQWGDYTLQLRWLPAHLPVPRWTMREKRKAERMKVQTDQFLEQLMQAMQGAGPEGPMPDLRGNPNLN